MVKLHTWLAMRGSVIRSELLTRVALDVLGRRRVCAGEPPVVVGVGR
jgi:hypothetical protein